MNRRYLLWGCAAYAAGACALALLAALSAAPAAAQKIDPDPKVLRLALLPDENAATIIQNARPLELHLERVLGREVNVVVTTDYSSMIEAMRFGRIDVAYFGPFSYVLARSKAPGIEPFAVGLDARGAPTYTSILIALADSPIRDISQVRGIHFGFGDQASTSSHLAPRALLAEKGLVGDKDYKVVHLGTHDAVARAVETGKIPAGALSRPIFESLVKSGKIDGARLRIFAETRPIPNYPMVMQSGLAPALREQIRRAFLELKDPGLLKNFRATGFVPTDDRAYDVLRDMAQVLHLDLARLQ
jgi:phosphonate transport system substrate-binding protein